MISREQVADLRVGDVVEVRHEAQPLVVTRGPLNLRGSGNLTLGCLVIRHAEGSPGNNLGGYALTVIERTPRPLYVNHDRTEPTSGDVARANDGTTTPAFYMYGHTGAGSSRLGWFWPNGTTARPGDFGLRLLVDGETGQVVP